MKLLPFRLFVIVLGTLAHPLSAQVAFTLRNDMLYDKDVHSAVPVGITDMNGDGLDDIVAFNYGRRLIVQYQTPDINRPFIRYESEIVLDNNEQNDIIIGDFNNDGWNDIIATGTYDRMKILYAEPYTYRFNLENITATAFFSQGASAGDFNHDGWLDAVILNDNGLNYTLMNDGMGKLVWQDYFDFVTVPPSDNSGNYGCVYTDFDMDGDVDFYIAKCRQGVNSPTDPRRINVLFVNDGTGQYTEDAANYGLASGRQSWTADFGDIDNDGDLDCFITQHDVISELYENIDNDTFVNITAAAGLNIGGVPLQGMFVDLDNDTYMDILVSGDRMDCYHNNGDKTFTRIEPFGDRLFGAFGLGDLNHDGFVDVYGSTVIPYNNPDPLKADFLFLNDRNDNNFVTFTLRDSSVNRPVIGAMALLYGPWGTQVREVRAGEQYGVSNSHKLMFGLGQHTTWDSLVIRWPDGARERFDISFANNKHHFLTRGGQWSLLVNQFPRLEVLCGQDSVKLFLDRETDEILWSTGATTDTITVYAPGIYYASFPENGSVYRTFPVEVIKDPDTVAPVIQYVGNLDLCASEEATISLPPALGYLWSTGDTTQSIQVRESGVYSALAEGYCIWLPSDSIEFTFVEPAAALVSTDTVQVGETAVVTAVGDSIVWYADGSGIFQIGSGDTLYLPDMTETRPVWARNVLTLEGQSGRVGQAAHAGTTKYNGAVTNAGLVFEVYKDMVLEELSVFTDSAGLRIIEIRDDSGQFGWDFPVDLAPGETRLRLDVPIPPGTYSISTNTNQNIIEFGVNSPILWRSSSGVAYPYVFGDIMAITNSTLNAVNFYYYFYDWQVSEADRHCLGDLVETTVVVDTVTSVADGNADLRFTASPNPVRDVVRISALPADVTGLEVIDARGRVWQSLRPTGADVLEVDMQACPAGFYVIRVTGPTGSAGIKVVKL